MSEKRAGGGEMCNIGIQSQVSKFSFAYADLKYSRPLTRLSTRNRRNDTDTSLSEKVRDPELTQSYALPIGERAPLFLPLREDLEFGYARIHHEA